MHRVLVTDRERILEEAASFTSPPPPLRPSHNVKAAVAGDQGVGEATSTLQPGPGQDTGRQEGTTRPWKHKKGKTDSRVQENPLSLASPEAFSANHKSWGAVAHKPWPLLSSLGAGEGCKEVGSS